MASLTGTKIKDTYDSLLKVSDNGALGASAKQITDGLGTGSPLYIDTTNIGIGAAPLSAIGNKRLTIYETTSTSLVLQNSTNFVNIFNGATVGDPTSIFSNVGFKFAIATDASATGFNEAMRIDSSGNVGIGGTPTTNTNRTTLAIDNSWGGQVDINVSGTNHAQFGTDNFSSGLSCRIQSADGIVFKGAAGAERMRITSGGFLKASNDGTYIGIASDYHELRNNASGNQILQTSTSASTNPYGIGVKFTDASPDNNLQWFFRADDSTAVRFYVYSDGDVWTSDAGTLLSDETLKRDITDASPKLDDIMKLRVRNYYWREDYHPNKQDKKLIGFIAQEFEEVFPNMVSEHTIKDAEYETIEHPAIEATYDEEGNELTPAQDAWTETTDVLISEEVRKKGIKEGKLIPILVKAMQEQQEIIQSLEARIQTLENK